MRKKARRRGRRGARAPGVEGGRGLLSEGRGVRASPARWASLGVPSDEEGGVGGSGDALKTKTIDEEEERREAAVYRRGTFSPGSIHRPGLKHL